LSLFDSKLIFLNCVYKANEGFMRINTLQNYFQFRDSMLQVNFFNRRYDGLVVSALVARSEVCGFDSGNRYCAHD
jgi:hypothetical protein